MRKKLGNFIHFIENESSFNHDERNHILHNLEDKHNRRMINLILILSSWSIISFFIESALIGGGLVFSIIHGIDWVYFVPEILFVLCNIIAKIIFVQRYLHDEVPFSYVLYASIPTVGPLVILGILIKDNVLLLKALREYMKYRRHELFSHFSWK